ncbi:MULTISPECIES: xanthine dehydrogenase family protein subunit M [Pseudomonas]|uniref:FAD binding domain-containing protein n=1 Tax=Pseudomonas TaxID=286 RepID=UPI001C60F68D|nr:MULTISPECIES: xanthine dehydrogenase family protein subunit M [Pseudomonas]MBW5414349.1 xanthine dehydrogenase family protein subunit M [Pseudomonas sp. MAG002Y]MCG7372077.1 xanthine dehydrogenase family protein subunit M [Pseudomonas luteola]
MNRFSYSKPQQVTDAIQQLSDTGRFIAGGTNLLDLMKENVARPDQLVDINALPLREIETTQAGGLHIGALVKNSTVAYHPDVERVYPLLSQAILAGASAQLRNMASTGGNLLQRTRCYYFYDIGTPCNKREPGSGCGALNGQNRIHAVLGHSDQCIAVHPSDMAVALAALEASVHVSGPEGDRVIPMSEFHRLPGDTPHLDTNLGQHELITAVELPPRGFAENYAYVKIRDRASYAFALVSVAAALELNGDNVGTARIALGGVAHKPWRKPEAEALLAGKPATEENFRAAAELLMQGAQGFEHNSFKIELAKRAIVRALSEAASGVNAK